MSQISARALHWVFKIGDREASMKFFRGVLGMKILRHEEFEKGCEATCNGPYDGKWSKTMIGYGPEDTHFVMELTYNYGIGEYELGNAFRGITIKSSEAIKRAKEAGLAAENGSEEGSVTIKSPDGYPFHLLDETQPTDGSDPVQKVSVSVSDVKKSTGYWSNLLGMAIVKDGENGVSLRYDGGNQATLELVQEATVNHAKASGRIAFACDAKLLPDIQANIEKESHKVLTPLVSLDTPGKATVQVVILGDPDGHEICFVGDAAFRELSQVDPNGEKLLDEALENDKSKEWYAKKGRVKAKA